MPEKRLLLAPAKSGILLDNPQGPAGFWGFVDRPFFRAAGVAAGVFVVVWGGYDLGTRALPLTPFTVPSDLGVTAFAPAIVALEPSALEAVAPLSSTTPLTPARLSIPALQVSAAVEAVGVKENGAMANPSSFSTTGWYEFGARPGEPGNAVIAGHVNNGVGLAGVFARLGELAIGARVSVADSSGRTLTYVVTEKARYDTNNAPLERIFTIEGPSQLVLITCEGDWDPQTRSYDKRLVVVARLVN